MVYSSLGGWFVVNVVSGFWFLVTSNQQPATTVANQSATLIPLVINNRAKPHRNDYFGDKQ